MRRSVPPRHGGLGIAALYAGEHLVGQQQAMDRRKAGGNHHQRFAAPAGFDNQHRFHERVTHHRAKAQLRRVLAARAKARLQAAGAFAIFRTSVYTVSRQFSSANAHIFGRVFHQKLQRAGAFVLGLGVDVDLSSAFTCSIGRRE